ncbi:L-lactate permease [Desulfosediminicola flagellatus]|uniref:L-lactate permease n=1 Tax=Desulfosediminicola flagellatus TaxID=2569541 RepID=UPI0010ABDFBF|nr:L-lactate permease [Desulfosediminicola flagellatus]
MTWTQIYIPLGGLGLSALVAAIPIIVLFYLLAFRRWGGHKAGGVAAVLSFLLAVTVWQMPVQMAVSATVMGVLVGLFPIIWIVITAIWLYNMSVESGDFDIIKSSLATLTDDRRIQALFIAFAFSSFLEGTAGFGTPVAIAAAMLTGLGFKPLYAAGICLIANSAPVAFGAIGIPVIMASKVTGLDTMTLSQIVGRQLPLISLIVPFWIALTMSGIRGTLQVLPALLVAGISFGGTQFILANYHGPYLPDIAASIVTIVSLIALLKVWKPRETWYFPDEIGKEKVVHASFPLIEVLRAWAPFLVLAVVVLLWGLAPVKSVLNSIFFTTFEWPALHNLVVKTTPIVNSDTLYGAVYKLNLVSAAGTAILLAGLLSVPLLNNYSFGKAAVCLVRTGKQLVYPIMTVMCVLALAYIMNYSGMSSTLGLAFAGTGKLFPFFAPVLGWLGVFLTGSCTSSNAFFGSLQATTATQIGVSPELMVAANATGGVAGKMISPQSLAVATSATGLMGREGDIFRFTIMHSLGMLLLICILVWLQTNVLSWMMPW